MNKTSLERLYNGLVKENPTFVLMLGMCPTLAVTTSAINGMGMGLTTAVVLALSNMIISLMRKIIPSKVRIPAFIVIIASFVTVLQLLLEAYLPSLNEALGVYIPLIVVNCIILGRAEAYAYFNPPIPSLFDGIGMGLGFTVALTMIGAVREVLGAAKIFGIEIPGMVPIGIFVLAPGAFFVLATLTAIQNFIKIWGAKHGKDVSKIQSGCSEDCMNCKDMGCGKRFYDTEAEVTEETSKEDSKETEKVTVESSELDFIDLDMEVEPAKVEVTEEVKPKRKPRKKAVKAQDVVEVTEETKVEVKEESKAEPVVEETVKTEAEVEPARVEVAAEVKPKRKPRKKAVKTEEVVEPTEEAKVESEVEPVVEETVKTEAEVEPTKVEVTEEVKPKRKPRKKTVKTEETVETSEEAKADSEELQPVMAEPTEETKPKRKPRKKTVKAEETVEVTEEIKAAETDQEKEDKS
ncbi:MAG: electron transport complex subunit E [Lachnospiraceae bacterium]|nr:electron transport complex subunit E [Lachnospiraceae bacterium]